MNNTNKIKTTQHKTKNPFVKQTMSYGKNTQGKLENTVRPRYI